MINIKTFVFNDFQINTYILSTESKECVIIDPGCYYDDEKSSIKTYISQNSLKPIQIINTHGHIDHIIGNSFIKEEYNISTSASELDDTLFKSIHQFGDMFGLNIESPPGIDHFIGENDKIQIGAEELEILHVPGHSPGSLAFYSKSSNFIIVGDVLFEGSIGRTDLPGGNYLTLINSIKNKLLVLDDNLVVYSGHGQPTTIGNEKQNNPFLN